MIRGGKVRRAFWLAIPLLVGLSVQVLAQQQHPHGPPQGFFAHHKPQAPPQANASEEPAVIDATSLGSPLVLEKGWRVGVSADPGAKNPDFDDSAWAVRDAHGSIADVSAPDDDSDHPRFAWFRLRLKLAPNHGPVALLIELPVSQSTSMNISNSGPGAEVFVNGTVVLPQGPHPDDTDQYQQISRLYKLPIPPSQTSATLAIRTIYISTGLMAYTNFFSNRTLRLGNPEDLNRAWELWSVRSLLERLPRLVIAILLTVLSIFLLTLFFTQKGHVEYLWLALHELVQVPITTRPGTVRSICNWPLFPPTSISNSSYPSCRSNAAGTSSCSATRPPFSPALRQSSFSPAITRPLPLPLPSSSFPPSSGLSAGQSLYSSP
jgi:hypothetical protein